MSVLDIRVLGDPILRQNTVPVKEITEELRTLVADMFETMHHARGIGLAAPQVGRTERLAVIEIEGEPLVVINPEIVETSGKDKAEEGTPTPEGEGSEEEGKRAGFVMGTVFDVSQTEESRDREPIDRQRMDDLRQDVLDVGSL